MTTVKELRIAPIYSDDEAAEFAGKHLGEKDFTTLIDFDADVYCAETGNVIAKFRKNVIPAKAQELAYNNLKKAAVVTDNRGISGGGAVEGTTRKHRVLSDGKVSKTSMAQNSVKSGIIGYFDATPRFPYCRQTAFNQHDMDKFKKAYPVMKVDNYYKELMPEHYAKQKEAVEKTPSEFVIKGTVFSTITVNMDWQTAVHQDKGDLKEGFGNLVALRSGKYTGGFFVVVKWGVAFDLQNGDLLLTDVHQWHGNTPIKKVDGRATRISLVMYYREKMMHCGTIEQELKKAKDKSTKVLSEAINDSE